MARSKLKILFCVAISLSFLVVPFALDIFPDGKAYGGGSRKGNRQAFTTDKDTGGNSGTSWANYTRRDGRKNCEKPHQVPEPGTWILLSFGLVGLAAIRRNKIIK